SPERRLILDINDFDETLPAPWEWDVKRLAASVVLASRQLNWRERHCTNAARMTVESYREHMNRYARMRALDVWYSHLEARILVREAKTEAGKHRWKGTEKKKNRTTAS